VKILSSFTQPQVVPNLNELLSSTEHKRRYFLKIRVIKQLTVAFDFYSMEKIYTMEVNGVNQIFKMSSFVFSRRKTPTCLEQHEGEQMMTEFLGELSL